MHFHYQRTVRLAEILNPQKNFESEKQMVEHRLDPLTGNSTVIPSGRFEYVKRLFQTDFQVLEKSIKESKINCSFCPKNVREKTPKFPSNLIPEGRIEIGEATIFPSLFAHMDFNAIAVICREHHLRLKEFAPERILNAFRGGAIYLNAVHRINPSIKYAVFAGNYLPPSGSSIFHPHMQILASDQPLHFIKQLHTASRIYASKFSANFWLELLEKERSGERYIGSTGSVEWLAPFAPMKTFEVWGISEKESSMLDLTEESWKNFAEGLGGVLLL
jgi:UDPglucose--hexose-1-phosphate uridylyltransferase